MRGLLLAEFNELRALKTASVERVKSILSRKKDRFTPKYSNQAVNQLRRNIFVGTTNKQDYLQADGGDEDDTRFFPVYVRGPIQYEAVKEMRDQLFAEAKAYYEEHKLDWWKIPADEELALKAARAERRGSNQYEAPIATWLARDCSTLASVHFHDIASQALDITDASKWSDALGKKIAPVMMKYGWEHKSIWDASTQKTQRMWISRRHEKHSAFNESSVAKAQRLAVAAEKAMQEAQRLAAEAAEAQREVDDGVPF